MTRLFRWLSVSVVMLGACEVVAPLDSLKVVESDVGDAADGDPNDASPTDVPVPDAAIPDAALPDAALPDAALPDAALPDAALPDAKLPDAEPDAELPMCVVDADCGPDLCRDGVCVPRVVLELGQVISFPDVADVVSLQADADPAPDLAVLLGVSSEVYIFLGAGDGTFNAGPGPFFAGTGPVSLAVGNFDDDLLDDLVVANNGDGSLTLLHALGGGDFTADAAVQVTLPPADGGAAAIAVGQLDGDALDDVVVADQALGELRLLAGTRPPDDPGYLAAPESLALVSRPSSLTARPRSVGADPSIVGVNADDGRAFVYTGVGPATLLEFDWLPDDGPISNLTLGDVDEDGVEDLVATVPGSDRVVLRYDNGGVASLAAGAGPHTARVSDLDGDGHLDAVMSNELDGTLGVNCGDGTGGFEVDLRLFNAGSGPRHFVVDDFNLDGLPDVFVVDGLTGELLVLMNRSPGPN